jgi:hypothetical protein
MTETESKWAARVAEWRASELSAPAFSKGKGFSPSGLRYWGTRLRRAHKEEPKSGGLRLARVVPAVKPAESDVAETPILIEIGGARLGVRRGFDAGALRAVLDVLGGER